MPQNWNQDTIHAAIQSYIEQHGVLPESNDLNTSNNLPSPKTIKQQTGRTFADFCILHFPNAPKKEIRRERKPTWSEEAIYDSIADFIADHGRLPAARELKAENKLPTADTIKAQTGLTYLEYCLRVFPDTERLEKEQPAVYTEEIVSNQIVAFYQQYKRLPKVEELNSTFGLPTRDTIRRRFQMAPSDFLQKFSYLYMNGWTREKMDQAIIAFYIVYKRPPAIEEFTEENGLPSVQEAKKLNEVFTYDESSTPSFELK